MPEPSNTDTNPPTLVVRVELLGSEDPRHRIVADSQFAALLALATGAHEEVVA